MGRQKTPLSRQLADIDLKLLRIFKAVVDAGGFSAAETELNIATSTISNYMSDLEKRLDMRLCTRGRAGFSVTEQGRVVYEATQELIEALEQFRNRINQTHHQLLGDLHIAMAEQVIYLQNSGLVDTLREFNEVAPGVKLHLHTQAAEAIPPMVADGSMHAGIAMLLYPQPQLRCEQLFDERMALYCGRGHELFGAPDNRQTQERLNDCSFIESFRMRAGHQFDPAMEHWRTQASAVHQESRLALILSGKFVGYLPGHLAQQQPWQADLHPLLPRQFGYTNTYQLMIRPQNLQNRILSLFRELLLKHARPPEAPVLHPM